MWDLEILRRFTLRLLCTDPRVDPQTQKNIFPDFTGTKKHRDILVSTMLEEMLFYGPQWRPEWVGLNIWGKIELQSKLTAEAGWGTWKYSVQF